MFKALAPRERNIISVPDPSFLEWLRDDGALAVASQIEAAGVPSNAAWSRFSDKLGSQAVAARKLFDVWRGLFDKVYVVEFLTEDSDPGTGDDLLTTSAPKVGAVLPIGSRYFLLTRVDPIPNYEDMRLAYSVRGELVRDE